MPKDNSKIPGLVAWFADQKPKHKHHFESDGLYHTEARARGDGWRAKKDPRYRGHKAQPSREPESRHEVRRLDPPINPPSENTDQDLALVRTGRSATPNNAPRPYEVDDRHPNAQSHRGRPQGLLTNDRPQGLLTNDRGGTSDDVEDDQHGRARDPSSHRNLLLPAPEGQVPSGGYGAGPSTDSRRPDSQNREANLALTRERRDLGGGRQNYHDQSSGSRRQMVRQGEHS